MRSILDEASGWLRSRGIDLWPIPFPMPRLMDRFAIGTVYLAYVDDAAVGTFSLQPSDPLFWGDQPDDALYLHGLAVRRSVGGQGVSQAMVAWAEGAVRAAHRPFLRLDTAADNACLCRFYAEAGFVDRGERLVNGWHCRLFEKRVDHEVRQLHM